ncbi:MAG TPA: signal peptidase II [bacterium]|nr:signal peptidase II [bacterium]
MPLVALSITALLVGIFAQWIRLGFFADAPREILDWYWVGIKYAENTGIAFSFPLEGVLLSVVTIVLILAILGYYFRYARPHPSVWTHVGYGLLLGGAISNAYERIFVGYVVDYISLRYFAVFNIADAAISIGVLILLILAWNERTAK